MATISIDKEWADGDILLESDLDNIKEGVETFLNVTKINDDNIQDSGITASSKLVDASISTAKLANLGVTTAKIDDLSVTTAKINTNAVTTVKILDANITKAKLATAARDGTAVLKSADATLNLAEDIIDVDTSGATRTMTLPAVASSSGHVYMITKLTSANTLVIDANSTELISGSQTYTLYYQYESITIACDGSRWVILSKYEIPQNTRAVPSTSGPSESSTSLVQIPQMTLSLTLRGKPVMVHYNLPAYLAAAGTRGEVAIFLDGSKIGASCDLYAFGTSTTNSYMNFSGHFLIVPGDKANGTYTLELKWKTDNAGVPITGLALDRQLSYHEIIT